MDNNMNQDIWQQPDSQFTQTPPKKNYDTAVLVLGIVSAVLALISSCIICCSPIPFVTAILAIVFAIITTRNGYDWNAMRIVGLVLGIVAILGLALWFIYLIVFMNSEAGQEYITRYLEMYSEMFGEDFSDFSTYYK